MSNKTIDAVDVEVTIKQRNLDRVKLFCIPEEIIREVLRGAVQISDELPQDAEIIGCHYDYTYRSLMARVYCESFEPVAPGQRLDVIHPVWTVSESLPECEITAATLEDSEQ